MGDYPSLDSFSVMFRPYRGRAVSGNIRFEVGDFFNGKQTRFGVSPQIKVTQNLSIDPDYEWNRISLPGIPSFSSGLPPGPDVAGTRDVRGKVTQSGQTLMPAFRRPSR